MALTRRHRCSVVGLLLAGLGAVAARGAGLPPEVEESIRLRLEHGYSVGIVIGIVNADGVQYYGYGRTELGGDTPDEHTLFEIGSITKVFTALLLADMAQRGEVALDDPIEKYLPEHVRAPTRNGQSITLAHLATHTSGLPRMPDNLPQLGYADYTVELLYEFLSRHSLHRDVGAKYEYSNVGVALLGHLLALRSGMTYEELVAERITEQLGMPDTRVTLTDDMQRRLAPGHRGVVRAANLDQPEALAGAGALRSTARDMLVFLAANLGLKGDRLQSAMKTTHERRHGNHGLGWFISGDPGIVSHGGTTFGYGSFAGFVTETRTGVVVLSNSRYAIQDIGRHLLDPSVPLHDIAAPPWFLLFTALGVAVAVAVVLWLIWKAGSVVWLSRCERAVCAAAAGWLALLALAAASEGNLLQGRLLAPLPIVLLLALPRRRAVRLTAAVTGFAWIFVLAAIMPAVPGPIIGYFDLLLLLSIAATCGLWIGLNLSLLANPPRRLWWYVVGGLMVVPVLALIQPFVFAGFLLPLLRGFQGQYLWALLPAAEIAVVLAGGWWLAVRLTGAREPRLGWRGALGQLGYWSLFLACLVVLWQ